MVEKYYYLKSKFVVADDETDPKAMQRINKYFELFKLLIVRGGNELRTAKFYQILYVVDYIQRHGCLMNYDGSCGEYISKTKIKDNTKQTNQ